LVKMRSFASNSQNNFRPRLLLWSLAAKKAEQTRNSGEAKNAFQEWTKFAQRRLQAVKGAGENLGKMETVATLKKAEIKKKARGAYNEPRHKQPRKGTNVLGAERSYGR